MIIICAFFLVLIIIPLICSLAVNSGFVDRPEGRKQHEQAVPPLGGFIIFTVFLTLMMVFGHLPWAVILALALILIVGVIDDAWEINAKFKFFIHFAAAFILVIGGDAKIESLGNLLGYGDINLGLMAIPFSVACVVYIQNAVNMMDGVDGLAGGNGLLVFIWLFLAGTFVNTPVMSFEMPVLMACMSAFLFYNMRSPFLKRAKIFLGDAGSMALGLMIAWYTITLSQGDQAILKPVSVAWILALPIIDSFGLLVTRLKEKRPAFSADRRHFHHHFLSAGFNPGQTSVIIIGYSFLLGAIGFFGIKIGVPEYILGWLWIVLWIGHTVLTIRSDCLVRKLERLNQSIQR